MFNCAFSYCDRPRFFQETMWMLLCGCGVGFSVQYHHISTLPNIKARTSEEIEYTIEDTIEGWTNALGVLLASYWDTDRTEFSQYCGKKINFNFSKIRPAGSPISWGGIAPGHEGLKKALENIEVLLDRRLTTSNSLRPIDAYDIVMFSSDAVLSGGVRRSATLCLFSPDDN